MEYDRSIFSEKCGKNGVGHLLGVLSDNLGQNFQSDVVAECSIRGAMHFAHTRAYRRKSLVGSQANFGSQKHKASNDFILTVAVLHGGLGMKNALQVRMGLGDRGASPKRSSGQSRQSQSGRARFGPRNHHYCCLWGRMQRQ